MTVHPVAYGPPALELLGALVADAKAGDALAPVTVVVPTNYAGVAARRALAERRGLAAVTFVTVYRLAELLGPPALAAQKRRPVSTPVIGGAIRQVLRAAPGVFAPVRGHPSTEQALLTAHRELRDLPDAAIGAIATASARAADVVRIHRAVTSLLAPAWYDETDLLAAAGDALAAGVPLARSLGTVIIHLPQDLSIAAGRLLAEVAARAPVHVVAGLTGDASADDGVHRSLARLGAASAAAASPSPAPAPVRVVTAPDAEDEVRAAIRHVIAAARAGTPLERMAVCYAAPEPYARLVAEQLAAAGIAHNGRAPQALRERVAPRTVLGLLDVAARGFRRHDLFAVLTSSPVRGLSGRRAPVGRWERLSREAGVVAGTAQWQDRLDVLAVSLNARGDELDAEGDGSPAAERVRRDAESARELAQFVVELAARLAPTTTSSWRDLARLGHELVDRYLGRDDARTSWPLEERQAADRLGAALDRLGALDVIDPNPSVEVFRGALELELDADLGRVGHLGNGVFVGPIAVTVGQDLDVVVVLGLVEGTFPARPSDDALLPDRERARVGGALPLAADHIARQHRHLLAALAAARTGIVLCAPRGDLRRSTRRIPSRWLLDVVSDRAGERVRADTFETRHEPWIEHVASFASGVRRADFPSTEQEHNLRSLLEHVDRGADLAAHPLAQRDAALRHALALVRARRTDLFTSYDGNLSGAIASVGDAARTDAVVSPTRLEAWARCPIAYLMRYVLRVDEVENPEDVLEMSALEKGNLLHATLEHFLAGVLARPEALQPAPDEAWTEADAAELLDAFSIEAERFHARGLTGRDLFWRRDRRGMERDLLTLLRQDSTFRAQARARPVATELRFGARDATVGAVQIALDTGKVVTMRGSADRLDRSDAGELLVTDYKSGKHEPYKTLSESEPTAGGTRLQLPVYALAARLAVDDPDAPARADYWFATSRGRFKRIGYSLTDAVLHQFRADLGVITSEIAAGHFPAHPEPPVWRLHVACPYCDPDGLGTAERWREWSRKHAAPELAPYLALTERQP